MLCALINAISPEIQRKSYDQMELAGRGAKRLLCTGVCLPHLALTYTLVCIKYYVFTQGDKGLRGYHSLYLQKP